MRYPANSTAKNNKKYCIPNSLVSNKANATNLPEDPIKKEEKNPTKQAVTRAVDPLIY